MTSPKLRPGALASEPRWVAAVTCVAIVAPLPYGLSRLLWAAGIPVGIDMDLLRELHSPGWGSLYILLLALLAEATAAFTHVFVRSRARRTPAWMPGLGDRPVRPRLVIAILLLPIAVLTWRGALHLELVLNGFRIPDHITGVPDWSLWAQAALVWTWGASLAMATLAYYRATRAWNAPAPIGACAGGVAVSGTPPPRQEGRSPAPNDRGKGRYPLLSTSTLYRMGGLAASPGSCCIIIAARRNRRNREERNVRVVVDESGGSVALTARLARSTSISKRSRCLGCR